MATQLQEMICWTQFLKQNNVKQGNLSHLLQDRIYQRDNNFNWTATHAFAASSEHLGVAVMKLFFKFLESKEQILLLKDEDGKPKNQILLKDKDKDIPIQSAIRSKAPKEIIELFLTIAKELNLTDGMLCSRNKKNQTLLLSAFEHSHWVAVDVLLEECVKCNKLPELTGVHPPAGLKSNTLLHRAFKRGNTKYFDIFLRVCNANGVEGDHLTAAVSIPNKNNETPWYYAIHNLSYETLEKVLKMAINKLLPLSLLYTDADRSTMLHEAHRMGSDQRCQLLKNNGAKDTPDRNGLLPIDRSRIIPNTGLGEEGATNIKLCTTGDGPMQRSESASSSLSSFDGEADFENGQDRNSVYRGSSEDPQ